MRYFDLSLRAKRGNLNVISIIELGDCHVAWLLAMTLNQRLPNTERSRALSNLQIQQLVTHHVGPIDLVVAAGETVSIQGPSGCGKSLLLRAIVDLDPHEGSVLLDGESQEQISGSEWRRRVGYLPATSQWWDDRVDDHFTEEVGRTEFTEWLTQLGFDDAALEMATATLSSGEKQRLALLRLLVNRPHVLLLDEPTASLDEENRAKVEALIDSYRTQQQCSVIWVSHDPQQRQRVATRHYEIREGKLLPLEEVAWN